MRPAETGGGKNFFPNAVAFSCAVVAGPFSVSRVRMCALSVSPLLFIDLTTFHSAPMSPAVPER